MAEGVVILAIAGQHSFFGTLENRGHRVQDVLNDPSTEFLQIHDVTVVRGLHGQCVKRIQEATIPKTACDFVLLETDRHEAPLRRQHAYVEKQPHAGLVLVNDYEICGTLLLKGGPDAVLALTRELAPFFPVTVPRVSRVPDPEAPMTTGVALINKSKVTFLHLERQAKSSTD